VLFSEWVHDQQNCSLVGHFGYFSIEQVQSSAEPFCSTHFASPIEKKERRPAASPGKLWRDGAPKTDA
jgi:hypothetical protein